MGHTIDFPAGPLAAWLAGWLAVWLAGRWAGCPPGWLPGCVVGPLLPILSGAARRPVVKEGGEPRWEASEPRGGRQGPPGASLETVGAWGRGTPDSGGGPPGQGRPFSPASVGERNFASPAGTCGREGKAAGSTVGGQNFASEIRMNAPRVYHKGTPPPAPPISMLSAVGPFRGCVKWTKWLHR